MEPFLTEFLQALGSQKGYSENTVVAYKNDLTQFGEYVHSQQGGAFDQPTEFLLRSAAVISVPGEDVLHLLVVHGQPLERDDAVGAIG